MKTTIENEFISLSVNSKGAEASSLLLKKDNTEYIWQGDPTYWHWQAPICFPIVGILAEGKYLMGEQAFALTVHGFARDMEFERIQVQSNQVTHRLHFTEETLKVYPFKFQLDICHSIEGKQVSVRYQVTNVDEQDMYFSIGGHTGFRCPIWPDEECTDYDLVFEQPERVDRYFVDQGLFGGRKESFLEGGQVVPVSPELFAKDVLIFKDLKSKAVSLRSRKSGKGITVRYDGFPYLGIWTKPTGAPFICIEPWFGLTDHVGTSKPISEKEGMVLLNPGQEFTCEHKMIID